MSALVPAPRRILIDEQDEAAGGVEVLSWSLTAIPRIYYEPGEDPIELGPPEVDLEVGLAAWGGGVDYLMRIHESLGSQILPGFLLTGIVFDYDFEDLVRLSFRAHYIGEISPLWQSGPSDVDELEQLAGGSPALPAPPRALPAEREDHDTR